MADPRTLRSMTSRLFLAHLVIFVGLLIASSASGLQLQRPSTTRTASRLIAAPNSRGIATATGTVARAPTSLRAIPLAIPLLTAGSTNVMALRTLASLPVMYSLMSFSEYVTHRYYQHLDVSAAVKKVFRSLGFSGGGHIEHHAETRDDMSLKTDSPRWMKSPAALTLDSDPYRGTAFSWFVTGLMFLQLLVTCVPVMKLLGWSSLASVGWIIPSLGLHTLVWNALHPAMHGLGDIPWREGPSGALLAPYRNSRIFKWLEANHVGHHVVGGRGNYNVCCPGCDNVFGTFVPEAKWKPMVGAVITGETIVMEEVKDTSADRELVSN